MNSGHTYSKQIGHNHNISHKSLDKLFYISKTTNIPFQSDVYQMYNKATRIHEQPRINPNRKLSYEMQFL